MKITAEEAVNRQTVLQIELEDEDLDPYLDRGYRKVVQRTLIPGFRKGKAPRRIVETYVGRESLLNEVMDDMLPEVTVKAIEEQALDAAGLPRIELIGLEPFTFKATIPLVPGIDLGAYRDIRIEQEPVEVTQEDIDNRLDQVRQSQATWDPVDRPVALGDMVTMQANGTVEDSSILDEQDNVYFLDEDSSRPFPGFSLQLVGMKVDEPKEFALEIPEDFEDDSIAGKEAQFSVTISDIKERILPELDDEFAKSVGDGYDNLEALQEELENDLKTQSENESTQKHREAIISELLKGATIELPPLIIEHEIDHMGSDRANMLARMNVRMDDYLQSIGKTQDDMREELRREAIERLERTFVMSKIAEAESLETTDEEVEERIDTLLEDSDQDTPKDQIDDETKSSIRRMLLAEKTMERLQAIAKAEAPPLAETDEETTEESPEEDATESEEQNQDEGGETKDDTEA